MNIINFLISGEEPSSSSSSSSSLRASSTSSPSSSDVCRLILINLLFGLIFKMKHKIYFSSSFIK